MKYADAQLVELMAWLLRDHAEIVSGAYKFRKTQKVKCFDETKDRYVWMDISDEEKLELAFGTMTRRCEFIMQCVDKFGESNG